MDYLFYGDLLIKLINSAVFGKPITDFPVDVDYDVFFKFCKSHQLENIAYAELKKLGVSKDKLAYFDGKYNFNIFHIAKQKTYLGIVKAQLAENKIPYLVLKGDTLSNLYPREDMRMSSDIDVFVGENSVKCNSVFGGLGFKTVAYNPDNEDHDEYTLSGVLCEVHPVLIQGNYPWKSECNAITERLLSDGGYEMKMSPEDFYLYNLAHAAKHMKFSGVGIKVFLDLQLIINKFGDKINRELLDERLKKANLFEFNKSATELLNIWFGDEKTNEKVEFTKEYIYSSGFCGTHKQFLANQYAMRMKSAKKSSIFIVKIKKSFELFLAPYGDYVTRYPILKKYRILTPFYRVGRVISAALFKRNTVKKVLGEFDNVDVEYSIKINDFKRSIGL